MEQNIHRKFVWIFLLILSPCIQVTAQVELPDSLVRERIQVIENMLNQSKKGANLWWNGWLYGYSAATVAQGAIVITGDNLKTRQDWSLGAISTLLGAAGQLIMPMSSGYTSNRLEEMPDGTPEENLLKLQEAENLLKKYALREQSGRSWKTHALDGALNLGFGCIMWFGLDRTFMEGFENIALNTAICEAQIFTQPTRAIKDYNYYCQKYRPGEYPAYVPPKISWYFTMMPGGLGVKMIF